MKLRCLSLLTLMLLAASPGGAQTGGPLPLPSDTSLIHLDTPVVPPKGGLVANLEIRAFGGDEDLSYTGIGVQYRFGDNWSGLLRGTFAGRDNYSLPGGAAAIRHGGSEVELVAKYRSVKDPHVAGLIGISFPDTAAQNDPVLTLGASAAYPLGKTAAFYLNPKAILLRDNLLLGFGFGVQARLSNRVSLLADITPLLAGENTRSTDDGDRERRSVYGIALRIARPDNPLSVDIGYSNGTGRTTGAALTPGLGGASAFYAGLTLRR
ncbi:MAG: hypothetical protein H7Z41_09210 [Cytophagales bacterium]|nr:hypothetical protein [Armatimonadota bacterium]